MSELRPFDLSVFTAHDLSVATDILSLLLEPSGSLRRILVPDIRRALLSPSSVHPNDYPGLLNLAERIVSEWSVDAKMDFLASHPRIGETKGLSAASSKEQASKATPPAVLARLESLNSAYEVSYQGLRYVIFVNGRTRSEIAQALESTLGLKDLPPPTSIESELGELAAKITSEVSHEEVEGEKWVTELERGLGDVWKIAADRLSKLS